jgi:hypothetical protein
MRFNLFGQSGLSMLQGLIVGSVLSGTALIATKLIQDQKKLAKGVESRDQIEQLHRMIYGILQNRQHCLATLASQSPPITIANLNDADRTVSKIVTIATSGASQDAFLVNTGTTWNPSSIYMNGNVTIESMTFSVPKSTDPTGQNVITYPSRLRIQYARLEGSKNSGNMNKRTKDGYGAKRVNKDIQITLQRNTITGAIDGCYAVQLGTSTNSMIADGNNNLNQEFCSNLGNGSSLYVWDSLANKCVLKNNICPDKFVFAGISSTGDAVCYPLNNYLGNLIDTSVSGCNTAAGATVSLTTDASGKVKIVCTP